MMVSGLAASGRCRADSLVNMTSCSCQSRKQHVGQQWVVAALENGYMKLSHSTERRRTYHLRLISTRDQYLGEEHSKTGRLCDMDKSDLL